MYTYTLCRQTIPPTEIAQHINDCCPTLQTNIFIFFFKKKKSILACAMPGQYASVHESTLYTPHARQGFLVQLPSKKTKIQMLPQYAVRIFRFIITSDRYARYVCPITIARPASGDRQWCVYIASDDREARGAQLRPHRMRWLYIQGYMVRSCF